MENHVLKTIDSDINHGLLSFRHCFDTLKKILDALRFTNDPVNGGNGYTANEIYKMIEFLADNIYVRFGGQLLREMVGIPM